MKKIKFVIPLFLFCFMLNVWAIDKCTTDETKRVKDIADNVQFKVETNIVNAKEIDEVYVKYKIQVLNFNDDLALYYRENSNDEFRRITISELEKYSFDGGIIMEFKIFAYTTNLCNGTLLKTEKIELPGYNQYYVKNKEKCDQYKDFEYCKELMNVKTEDFEKIDKKFQEYLKENNINIQNSSNENRLYIIIAGIIFILLIVIIVFYLRKNKKKNLDI